MTTETITSAVLALPESSRVIVAAALLRSLPTNEQFERYRSEWKVESQFLSSSVKMAMLPSYQRIIGLGPAAIPLILAELRHEPDHWFWALEALTGENPVPEAALGDLQQMSAAWVAWGKHRGHCL